MNKLEKMIDIASSEYEKINLYAEEIANSVKEQIPDKEYTLEELNIYRALIVQRLNENVNYELCRVTMSKAKK